MARSVLRIGGSLALLIFPLMFMMVFVLHVENPSDMLELRLRHDPYLAADIMAALRDAPHAQRYYVLPHMLGYLSMPFLIAAALSLGYILFDARPWWAIVGVTMTCVGAVFMAGMLAMWLAFAAIGNVPGDQVAGATAALEALIEMQGPLLYSTILTGFSLLGLMILAVGLFLSGVVPGWSAVMIFIGSLMMTLFIDLDNLMFAGAFMTFCGMAPIARMLFKGDFETRL
jgi:hypothetical protein